MPQVVHDVLNELEQRLKIEIAGLQLPQNILIGMQQMLGGEINYQPQYAQIKDKTVLLLASGAMDMDKFIAMQQFVDGIVKQDKELAGVHLRIETGKVAMKTLAGEKVETTVYGFSSNLPWDAFHGKLGPALKNVVDNVVLLAKAAKKADAAMTPGGIDLQAKSINLKIDADKAMVNKPIWDLNNVKIEGGLVPTIIGIKTKIDLPMLLGLKQETGLDLAKV